jgi:hypothetical protein
MKADVWRTAGEGSTRRHRAAVLLIVAAVFWWHRWVPALLLTGIVSWAILHGRLEGDLGRILGRLWRRAWPPRTMMLVPLLSAATLVYLASDEPIVAKVLPIALNVVALSTLLLGSWWTMVARPEREDGIVRPEGLPRPRVMTGTG